MVNPSRRDGQRRKAISFRTSRGKFGSSRTLSPPSAAAPASAVSRINFRRLIGADPNRSRTLDCSTTVPTLQHTPCRTAALLRDLAPHFVYVGLHFGLCGDSRPRLSVKRSLTAIGSEAERGLQIEPAVGCRTRRERASLQRVRNIKESRS